VRKVVLGSLLTIVLALALKPALASLAVASGTLDIYFIDVEGGQSTLVITPAGQSLLVDTGYAGFHDRDPGRILAVARAGGITRIDYLLLTHFHPDHDGGVVEIARQMPIGAFVDYGDLHRTSAAQAARGWAATLERYNAYVPVRARGQHLEPKPGDRLALEGVDVTVVSSAGATIADPLPGAGQPTAGCESAAPPADDRFENPRSIGFVLQFGVFRFLDLGDLTGAPLFALVCPRSLTGAVDLYLVPHHGARDASYPATFAAVRPRAVVVNNGATKGGSPEVFASLRRAPGPDASWQLDTSKNKGAVNLPDAQIANLDKTTAHWIKVSATQDGAFTVTNGRTGATKAFAARPTPQAASPNVS
jgi:beta-lactamase superfamily II metal-dependent hydrolase